jgi:hypothetical protein
MSSNKPAQETTASQLIDAKIRELGDWRGEMLGRLRGLIKQADPEVIEEWKWGKVPVWSHDGILSTGETYKAVVKMTFAKGASLPDPAGLFNSSLEGNTRRAIDFHEGENINEAALKALIRAAVAMNQSTVAGRAAGKKSAPKKAAGEKPAVKKTTVKKMAVKKPVAVAKKATAKKPAAPKKAARKSAAR